MNDLWLLLGIGVSICVFTYALARYMNFRLMVANEVAYLESIGIMEGPNPKQKE